MDTYYPTTVFYGSTDIGMIFEIPDGLLKQLQKVESFDFAVLNDNNQLIPIIKIKDVLNIPLSLIDIDFLEKNDNSSVVLFAKTEDNIIAKPILQIKADKSFILECKAIEKALKMKID